MTTLAALGVLFVAILALGAALAVLLRLLWVYQRG